MENETTTRKTILDYAPSAIVLVALVGFWFVSQVQVRKLEERLERVESMLVVKPADVLKRIEEMEATILEAIE